MTTRSIVVTDAQIITALKQRQRIALRGIQNLEAFRRAVHQLAHSVDMHFVFDPETDTSLRDYLAAGGLGAVEGAALGGAIGLALGLLADEPQLAALCALAGGLIGGVSGVNRVRSGWRVRATLGLDNIPDLLLQPI